MSKTVALILIGLVFASASIHAQHHHDIDDEDSYHLNIFDDNWEADAAKHVDKEKATTVAPAHDEESMEIGSLFDEVAEDEPKSIDQATLQKNIADAIAAMNQERHVKYAVEKSNDETTVSPIAEATSVEHVVVKSESESAVETATVSASSVDAESTTTLVPAAPKLEVAEQDAQAKEHVQAPVAVHQDLASQLQAKIAERKARQAHKAQQAALNAEIAARVAEKNSKKEAELELTKEATAAKAELKPKHDALLAELHAKFEAKRQQEKEAQRSKMHEELAKHVAAKEAEKEKTVAAIKADKEAKATIQPTHDALMKELKEKTKARRQELDFAAVNKTIPELKAESITQIQKDAHALVMAELKARAQARQEKQAGASTRIEISGDVISAATLEKEAELLVSAEKAAELEELNETDLMKLETAVNQFLLAAKENEEANALVEKTLTETPRLTELYNQIIALNKAHTKASKEEKAKISKEFLGIVHGIVSTHSDKFPALFEELARFCMSETSKEQSAENAAARETLQKHLELLVQQDLETIKESEKEIVAVKVTVDEEIARRQKELAEKEKELAAQQEKEARVAVHHDDATTADEDEILKAVRKVEGEVRGVEKKVDSLQKSDDLNAPMVAAASSSSSQEETESVPIAMIAGIVAGVAVLAFVVIGVVVIRKRNAARRAGQMETPVGV